MAKENPHDKFFKENFSRQSVAKSFLTDVLKAPELSELTVSTLRLTNNSYVSKDLDESFADLVYSCELAGKPVKIALLFEHKSYTVKYPHVQLLGYLFNSLQEDLKQKRAPTLVIPIIFYHGDQRWKPEPLASYYGAVPPQLLPFVPEFTYLLFDLSVYPDEQIQQLRDRFLATSMLLMKHRKNTQYVRQNGEQLFLWMEQISETEEGETYLRTVFVYLAKITKTVGRAAVNKVFGHNPMARKFASLYDWMEHQATQKGLKQGMQLERTRVVLNVARYVPDPAQIATMTGYPLDEVKRILAEANNASA